jgi:hypothetical protein
MPSRPLFLLSDFGLQDAYVGVLHARIAALAPDAPVHDLHHLLPPQDLRAARLTLAATLPWLPCGSVVCAVIDPGVGLPRHGVALRSERTDGRDVWLVAPDNGLLSGVLQHDRVPYGTPFCAKEAWRLERAALPAGGPGTTFDGRDLFAPAAALLARGDAPASIGTAMAVDELVRTPAPALAQSGSGVRGRIVWIDRFGNLVSDVPPASAQTRPGGRFIAEVAGRSLTGPAPGFAAVPPGAAVAYVGSLGTIEFALRDGDAANDWGVSVDAEVTVRPAATAAA